MRDRQSRDHHLAGTAIRSDHPNGDRLARHDRVKGRWRRRCADPHIAGWTRRLRNRDQ
jgi:hypothetical protein